MNMMKKIKEKCPSLPQGLKWSASGALLISANTYAALPESVKTALEGAKTDGMEAGWLVVGIIAALFVIAIVKRLLR